MAERRMFAKTIVLSDAFLDMPLGARCLYMTMGMMADDDGFVNNAKSIIRQVGASEDDLRILITKKFVLLMDKGLIVIKHWRINNYLRNDRYQETKYVEEKMKLLIDENGSYKYADEVFGIPSTVYPDKDSIGKNSIGNNSKARFTKPSLEELQAYCNEKNYTFDAQRFYDYYESNGWHVGKNPMKDWKAAVRNWARMDKGFVKDKAVPDFTNKYPQEERKKVYTDDEFNRLLGISEEDL